MITLSLYHMMIQKENHVSYEAKYILLWIDKLVVLFWHNKAELKTDASYTYNAY